MIDIQKFLDESSLKLQSVFNSTCGFWITNKTLLQLDRKAIYSISQLENDAKDLCKIKEQEESLCML